MSVISELKKKAADTEGVQRGLLKEVLEKNAGTEFGRELGFAEISSYEEYRDRIPLSEWEDYEERMERIAEGENNILISEEPVYFCISSGSSSKPKYIPLTRKDVELQIEYWLKGIPEVIRNGLPGRSDDELFGRTFYTSEFYITDMPDGRMNGVRTGAPYRYLDRLEGFDCSAYTSPKEVLFPEKLEDMLYVKVRFALAERDVTAVSGIFVNRMVGLFQYIVRFWDELIHDMETGTVSEVFDVSDEWKEYLGQQLPADPERAAELRTIDVRGGKDLIKKIWKKLAFVSFIGGSIYSRFMDDLREFTGDTPIHYFVYAASESNFGIATEVDDVDAYYTLTPDTTFFEFIPVGGDGTAIPAWEVEKGKQYEFVITTVSGLYRYQMQDVIEVVDFFEKSPIVRICYRKNLMLNVSEEYMNLRQLEKAIEGFSNRTGMSSPEFCVEEIYDVIPPRYRFYVEAEHTGGEYGPEKLSKIMDEELKNSCYTYQVSRDLDEIDEPLVFLLKRGAFREYEQLLSLKGYRMEQNKPIRILKTQEQREFFSRRVRL
ncbi:MAG: GH3 auxin-responsive promoter family protein [Eubacterium sp.]|nr:GH3 auxin-responsive promoter family protein [Eubacterium sp.]